MSQGIRARVQQDMASRAAVLGAWPDLKEVVVQGRPESTHEEQGSVRWPQLVESRPIGVLSTRVELGDCGHALKAAHRAQLVERLQNQSWFDLLFLARHDVHHDFLVHGHDQSLPSLCAQNGRQLRDRLLPHANALDYPADL